MLFAHGFRCRIVQLAALDTNASCVIMGSACVALFSLYFGVIMIGLDSSTKMRVCLDILHTPLQFCPVYSGQFCKAGCAHLCLYLNWTWSGFHFKKFGEFKKN